MTASPPPSLQAPSLAGLESLSSVQTKGVKRQLVESKEVIRIMQTEGVARHQVTIVFSPYHHLDLNKGTSAMVFKNNYLFQIYIFHLNGANFYYLEKKKVSSSWQTPRSIRGCNTKLCG